MPRAFLITNKRYKSAVDYEDNHLIREESPERGVSTAEGPLYIVGEGEADSTYDSLKPTSPHSPAHESRGPSSNEDESQDQPLGLTVVRTPDSSNLPPYCPSSTPPCVLPCQSATALVSVIRQLMHQPVRSAPLPLSSLVPETPRNFSGYLLGNSNCNSDAASPNSSSSSSNSQDNHICSECGKRYSTSSNLARHRQTHRSVTDKKARKCPHCDKVYVSMPAYSMHVRTHSQGCQCPYCGKCFSRPWLLQGHIRTHTGEKPFTCPVCHKAFADKSNLRAHIQTHSSSKPYVCQRCGKAFALKSYLYKHEESSCMRVHRQHEKLKESTVLNLAKDSDRSAIIVG